MLIRELRKKIMKEFPSRYSDNEPEWRLFSFKGKEYAELVHPPRFFIRKKI